MNAADFLHALYGNIDSGWLEVTLIHPERPKNSNVQVMWRAFPLGEVGNMNGLHEANAAGWGIYFGVGVRPDRKDGNQRGKAHEVTAITALWADIDIKEGGSFDHVDALDVPPNIVVTTGGGWHLYWLLREPLLLTERNRAAIKRTLKGIAVAAHSDTKVAEFARVMRLPDFDNTKPGRGETCRAFELAGAQYPYRYDTLEAAFAGNVPPDAPMPTRTITPLAIDDELPKWVCDYLTYGAAQGERNNRLYAAAVEYRNHDLGYSRCQSECGGRGLADGLSQSEVDRTIQSAYSGAPNPAAALPNAQRLRMAHADKLTGDQS